MITCQKFSLIISEYIDGELDREICQEIVEHITYCPTCKQMHYAYSRLITFCHHCCEIEVPANAHNELWQSLHDALECEKTKQPKVKRKKIKP